MYCWYIYTACRVVCTFLLQLSFNTDLSAVSQVTLLDPFHGPVVGTLHVTNYKVFFRKEPEDSEVPTYTTYVCRCLGSQTRPCVMHCGMNALFNKCTLDLK